MDFNDGFLAGGTRPFSNMVSLAYDNGMGYAIGAGIPAPSDAIDVCASKHQSALIGGDGDSSSTVDRAK